MCRFQEGAIRNSTYEVKAAELHDLENDMVYDNICRSNIQPV